MSIGNQDIDSTFLSFINWYLDSLPTSFERSYYEIRATEVYIFYTKKIKQPLIDEITLSTTNLDYQILENFNSSI